VPFERSITAWQTSDTSSREPDTHTPPWTKSTNGAAIAEEGA
jgi:hypothetical protein